jgi:hypothetical protein
MSFGKRPSTASAQAAAPPPPTGGDPHNRRKVFPDAVWHGQSGSMLRELGFSPTDESNLVPNASSINARLENGKRRIDERLEAAQSNARAKMPGAQLRPFFLIPDPIWNGESGTFLMTSLDLYPYDDWNVVFLAGDERTAIVMDIALHPSGNVPTFVTAAEKFMPNARAAMKRATDEAELTSNFAAFAEAREDVQLRVKGLAMSFARALIEAWEKQKDPHARSPFATDEPVQTIPARDEEPTGFQAIVDELKEEAESQAKDAVFSAARSAFGALMRRGE